MNDIVNSLVKLPIPDAKKSNEVISNCFHFETVNVIIEGETVKGYLKKTMDAYWGQQMAHKYIS